MSKHFIFVATAMLLASCKVPTKSKTVDYPSQVNDQASSIAEEPSQAQPMDTQLRKSPAPKYNATGPLVSQVNNQFWSVGEFRVHWNRDRKMLVVRHIKGGNRVLWSSVAGENFVALGSAKVSFKEKRGSFDIKEQVDWVCTEQTFDQAQYINNDLVLSGGISGCGSKSGQWFLTFSQPLAGHLKFELDTSGANFNPNLQVLKFHANKKESFFGFGEQFTYTNLNGKYVPIFAEEGGIGRGRRLIGDLVNIISPGSSGEDTSSYAPVPQFITSTRKSMMLENKEYSSFDLRHKKRSLVTLWSNEPMVGRIFFGDSVLELVERYTEYAGRMAALPDWMNEGAIVGMQGGTEFVREKWEELKAADTPIGAFWLQDWEGKRKTAAGSQLWWNWELDRERYPDWENLVGDFAQAGIRMMGYINPFLVDVEAAGKDNVTRNFYLEAKTLDYLVKDEKGEPYPITNTDFDAGLVDLSNPEARSWMGDIIQQQMIDIGFSGWMADFGEALPMDSVLYDGSPEQWHNRYPEEWARVNQKAVADSGRTGDIVFFSRSGFSQSPGVSTLFWEGDQMTTWDGDDGFRSALKGLISGGFSGYSLNHSDIGGYTSIKYFGIGFSREKSLFMRWAEANAFSAVYRTHDGIMPEVNFQFYSNDDTIAQFSRFAKVYKALTFYRKQLFVDAETKGWPVVRHPIMHFPEDKVFTKLPDDKIQFLLGSEFIVAPILNKWFKSRRVWLPKGKWVHVWSKKVYQQSKGRWYRIAAPVGEPPVFFRQGSAVGQQFLDNLAAEGVR